MHWLRPLLTRRWRERELADEIAQHLEEKVEALMAAGASRDDAERAARRAFGNVTLTMERGNAVWRWSLVEDLWADVRYAVRQLRRSPTFAAAAVLTLAVGIGVNAGVFTLVNALVLRPLPFPHADRLVSLRLADRRDAGRSTSLAYFTFFEMRRAGVFERLTSYRDTGFTLTGGAGDGAAMRLDGAIVGWDLFETLGVPLALGRGFAADEETAGTRVVVISHELWATQLRGDPQAPGRVLTLDGQPYTVVGVAPAGFRYPTERRVQVWTTIARDEESGTGQPITRQRGARTLDCVGLLTRGETAAQAEARASAVAAVLAREHPDSNRNFPAVVVRPEGERVLGPARVGLFILWGAVTLVLLMACANLANMLLARAADRQHEIGVRLAIGAGRGRVTRQLITENLVLAVMGAVGGMAGAIVSVRALVAVVVERAPFVGDVGVDARVLAFTTAVALITSVLVSLPAILAIRRLDIDGTLRGSARGATDSQDRLRGALVVGQVAIGLVLLSAAMLLAASLWHIVRRDLGLRTDHLLAVSIALSGDRYRDDGQLAFASRAVDAIRRLGGVEAVSGAQPLPLVGDEMVIAFDIQERPAAPSERPRANFAIVTPEYFSTIGTPLIDGRDFTGRDDGSQPRVAIVNEAFAARFFPGARAVGKRIAPGASSRLDAGAAPPWREIVGVVANVRQSPLARDPEPIYYVPYRQMPWQMPTLLVRSARASTPADIRRAVAALDPHLPVELRTVQSVFDAAVTPPRIATWLMGTFAAIGLLLTATGLYGLLSYAVLRRTRELGVRLALGASRARVVRLVVSRALALVGLGLLLGGVGAAAVTSLLRQVLDVPDGSRVVIFVAVVAVTVVTAVLAAAIPARRAASIDPVLALRAE